MTPKTIKAVYENGVFRPLEHLDLPESTRVTITIEGASPSTAGSVTSCYDLALQGGIIGVLKDAPRDLSTNSDHFQGFVTR